MEVVVKTSSRQCDVCFDPVPLWDGITRLCHTKCPAFLCIECTERYFTERLSSFIPGILSKIHCPICLLPMPLIKYKAFVAEDVLDYAETCLFASSELRCPSCDDSTPFVRSSSPSPPPLLLPASLRQKIPWLRRLGTKFCRYTLSAAALYDYISTTFASHFQLTYDHVLQLIHDPERRAAFVLYHLHQTRLVKTPCCKYEVCFECKAKSHRGACQVLSTSSYNFVVACPECNIWIVRGDGCDTMKCVCSAYFSWNDQVLVATQRKYNECLKILFARLHGRSAMVQVSHYLRQLVWRRQFQKPLLQLKVIAHKKTWKSVQLFLRRCAQQRKRYRELGLRVFDELNAKIESGRILTISNTKSQAQSQLKAAPIA